MMEIPVPVEPRRPSSSRRVSPMVRLAEGRTLAGSSMVAGGDTGPQKRGGPSPSWMLGVTARPLVRMVAYSKRVRLSQGT